ncbi:MAG: tRNA lysidine(34) synthetase TilS [Treponema sp.]|nr:tRNA lysidine(34) synthetase TilS [Treponema sp.]
MDLQLSEFENRVLEGLKLCGVDLQGGQGALERPGVQLAPAEPGARAIGAAVSGGADSLSLLYSLAEITRALSISLKVITVNHFIRPDEESCGDAQFVLEQCKSLQATGYDLSCNLVELPRGAVDELARKRGGGIEEAARYLRYQAFEAFMKKNELEVLCLAHNKNDQLETLLMRFLQGSWSESSSGIQMRRPLSGGQAAYVRPLLNIDRSEIEAYLKERGLTWRTDATNSDTAYFRNRVRAQLVPLLNENFSGWQKALLNGAEKAMLDAEVINQQVELIEIDKTLEEEGLLSLSISIFKNLLPAIQIRLLMKMFNILGLDSRIPYQFFKDFLTSFACKRYSDIEISVKKDRLFVKKCKKIHTDLVFFDIIKEEGEYDFPFGKLSAGKELLFNGCATGFSPKFPFAVRNLGPGDEVLCADGNMKKVADVFAGWKVSAEDKPLIPLIVDLQDGEIKALCAAFLGYKDWIVK